MNAHEEDEAFEYPSRAHALEDVAEMVLDKVDPALYAGTVEKYGLTNGEVWREMHRVRRERARLDRELGRHRS